MVQVFIASKSITIRAEDGEYPFVQKVQ